MGLQGLLLPALVFTLVGCMPRSQPARGDDEPKPAAAASAQARAAPTENASTAPALSPAQRPPPLEIARRINGDAAMLPLSPTDFSTPENLRSLAVSLPDVEYADVFAVWNVQIAAGGVKVEALLKLQAIDPRIAKDLGLSSMLRGEATAPPAVALGALLAKTLRVGVGDEVVIEVAPGAGTDGAASIGCRVAEVVAFGHEHYDRQLIFADVMHRSRFRLKLTGVELRASASADRRAFVERLRSFHGDDVAVVPVEELVKQPPSASSAQ